MPYYYIYKIAQSTNQIVSNLQKIDRFEAFKEAKQKVRELRQQQNDDSADAYKIIFAESELKAEEMLMEKREAPVVMEWEK
jgi:hypothetical protein